MKAKHPPIHSPPPPRSEPRPSSTAKKQPPVHTPPGSQMREADKIPEGNKLIKEIRAEGKFKDYTNAREEARRRNPALFS